MLLPGSDESIVVERGAVVEAGPVRAGVVRTGMDQTVANLKSMAEGSGGGGGMFGWVKKIFGS